MMGPVQENDTRAKVNAIKNMLKMPVVLTAFESMRFVQLDGKVNSNAPKNDTANSTNIAKNMRLNTALVANSLSIDGPNISVTIVPNRRYTITIDAP